MTNNTLVYCRIEHLRTLELSGSDQATRFLQSQVTGQVTTLLPNQGIASLLCNRRGQVVTDLYIQRHETSWRITLPNHFTDQVAKKWRPLLQLSNISHSEITETTTVYLLSGPINGSIALNPSSRDQWHICITDTDQLPEAIQQAQYLEQSLIEAKIQLKLPSMTLSNSEKMLPQQLGYVSQGYVDFKKGCYLGQEVIARVEFKSNKKFYPILLEIPEAYSDQLCKLLCGQQVVGQIVYTHSGAKSVLGLGYLTTTNIDMQTITLAGHDQPLNLIEYSVSTEGKE